MLYTTNHTQAARAKLARDAADSASKQRKLAMCPSSSFFLPIFLLALLAADGSDHAAVLAADQFTYNDFSGANLTLDGLAAVAPNGLLALSNGTSQAAGHAFHPTPVRMRNGGGAVQSFSVAFVFAIVSNFTVLSDNGMAFVVAPSTKLSTFNAGQYLGILNVTDNGKAENGVFAVELDTMLNPEFQDMNSNHVGVDVNSMRSVQNHSAGYYDDATGAFNNLSLISRQPMQVWVDYDGATTRLDVAMAPLDVPRPKKPLISAPVNLSAVLVTDTAYVGFSAATGVIFTRHYVLGWSFALNGPAPPLDASKLPALPRFGPKPRSKVLEIVLPIATAAFVLALAIAFFLFVRTRVRYAEVREDWEVEFGPHRFSYRELYKATKGFKNRQLLGTGGFGRVYKGVLPKSNLEVAVKRVSHDSKQGMKEFIAEVVSLGHLRHRNLVQLLGYCRRQGELLLVYDCMPNGSLDKYLYDKTKPVLDWGQRFQIIRGVASGLLYLHEDWEKVVIHRDIKASNVLLDAEMNGRLGDFGLARLYDHGLDPQTTHVVGTIGYLAPELVRTGKATPATDVFAFGVFVLEVACGRRPLGCAAPDDQSVLLDWVQERQRRHAALDAVDPRLCGKYDADEARLAIKLGLMCAHPLPDARPGMRQATQYLDGEVPMPELVPTFLSYTTLALMQNDGFDSFAMSFPSTVSTSASPISGDVSAVSGLSGGR